ncbi:cell wall hydrolase [Candidatus Gottesmanbacteria bacterium]|nr:cell wall hydrolase [Candidatus Gottesmanbacteria bacterium]
MMQTIFTENKKSILTSSRLIPFKSYSAYHLVTITARIDEGNLMIKIDGKIFSSPATFSGSKLHNLSQIIYFLLYLSGGEHTIDLKINKSDQTATLEAMSVYTFLPEINLTLESNNQAENGDRRPWLTFVLSSLPLKSFTPTLTYSRRHRDSDDIKIIIDGQTQFNFFSRAKYHFWRFAGFLLPKNNPTRTTNEAIETNLKQGLHSLEFYADRIPKMDMIILNFGEKLNPPIRIPTVQNPKWTGSFYDDPQEILLARAIYGEAGGEPEETKTAVGWSIRNRVEDSQNHWGKTYYEVILQPEQYDPFTNPKNKPFLRITNPPLNNVLEKQSWEKSVEIAQKIIDGELNDPTNGANHFYSIDPQKPDWKPPWTEESKFTVQTGVTRFYKL